MKKRPVDKQIRTIDDMHHPCTEEEGIRHYTCQHCEHTVYDHKIYNGRLCDYCEGMGWEIEYNKNTLDPAKNKVEKCRNRLSRILKRKSWAGSTNARRLKEKAAKKLRAAERQLNELEKHKLQRLRNMEACYSSAPSTA